MKFRVTPALERIMNDPKLVDKTKAWIGCDLDGTLAVYDGWKGWQHIGDPVEKMVGRLKSYMDRGITVKIWTARCSKVSLAKNNLTFDQMANVIQDWTEKVFGKRLEVVTEKDCDMLFCFDDSVIQVEPNTGEIIGSEIKPEVGDDQDYDYEIKEYDSADVAHQGNWKELKLDTCLYQDFVSGLLRGGFGKAEFIRSISPEWATIQASTNDNITRFSFLTCRGNLHNENPTDWVVLDVQLANGSNRMFFKLDNLSFKSLGKWIAKRVLNHGTSVQVVK